MCLCVSPLVCVSLCLMTNPETECRFFVGAFSYDRSFIVSLSGLKQVHTKNVSISWLELNPFFPHHRQFSLSALPFFFLPSFHCNTQFEVRCIWIKTAHGCIWLFYWIDQQADGLSALVENIIMYACTEAKLLLPICSVIASRLVLKCSLDPDVVKHILMQDVRLAFALYLWCECSCGSDIITWNWDIGEFKSKLAVVTREQQKMSKSH